VILYTDKEPYCCAVLRARVADGGLPPGDVWERDVKTIKPAELKPYTHVHLFAGVGAIALGFAMADWPLNENIWTAGFPCQPVSINGKGAAQEDERWLWPEVARLVDGARPKRLLLENVTGLLARGLGIVLGDLARIRYDAEWDSIPAAAIGSPHLRERVFVVSHPASPRPQGEKPASRVWRRGMFAERRGWMPEPGVCRVADGAPHRVERITALGNAVVPQVVELIARGILQMENEHAL